MYKIDKKKKRKEEFIIRYNISNYKNKIYFERYE